jgi:hypothetical protein
MIKKIDRDDAVPGQGVPSVIVDLLLTSSIAVGAGIALSWRSGVHKYLGYYSGDQCTQGAKEINDEEIHVVSA